MCFRVQYPSNDAKKCESVRMSKKNGILVAYYSLSGNTKKAAEYIASRLDADIEEITESKKRKGLFNFIAAGRDVKTGKETRIETVTKTPGDYNTVFIGTPVWAGGIPPAVRTYLNRFRDDLHGLFLFTTSKYSKPESIARTVELICGKKVTSFAGITGREIKDETRYRKELDQFLTGIGFVGTE